jgi:hypothetical protein
MRAFKDRITRQILEICLGFRFELETERKKVSPLAQQKRSSEKETQ